MDCPGSKKIGASGLPFCPSKAPMNEHHNEWWSEYYCTTCGYEQKDRNENPREIKRGTFTPSPPRRKRVSTQY